MTWMVASVAGSLEILLGTGNIDRYRSEYTDELKSNRHNKIIDFQFCLYFGVITILLGCVGILGNLLSILVLQTRSIKSCFNNLLTALNISDR